MHRSWPKSCWPPQRIPTPKPSAWRAANGRLRQLVNDGAQKLGAKVYLPELKYCGDNGAMIAAQGYYEFKDGNIADLTLNGLPTLAIDYR